MLIFSMLLTAHDLFQDGLWLCAKQYSMYLTSRTWDCSVVDFLACLVSIKTMIAAVHKDLLLRSIGLVVQHKNSTALQN